MKKEFHNLPVYITMCTNRKDTSTMKDMHYHNGYEFFFVTSGNNEFFFEDCNFCLSKGKVLIIPPGIPHKSIYSNSTAETYRIELHILPSKLSDVVKNITSSYTEPTVAEIYAGKRDYIYELIHKLYKESAVIDNYSDIMQAHYIDELLIYISRYSVVPEDDTAGTTITQLIMNYINDNYQNKISVSDISKHLHINERTLYADFKKNSRLTISEYINYVRISSAEQLLLFSDLSITDIAFKCGFNDSNYFSSVFKKIKGVSPTQYTKKTNPNLTI